MGIKQNVLNQFGKRINKIYFETEDSNEFLRIEVNFKKMDDVVVISKEISIFLDGINFDKEQYILDIFSSGAEVKIDVSDLKDYINKLILVNLKKEIKTKMSFEGELIEVEEKELTIRWNAKGQFRKQKIYFDDIENMNLSIKVRKGK